jgi:hypothetical protein
MYVMSGECPTYEAGGLVCRHELVTQSFSRPEGPGMKPGSQQASPLPPRGGGGGHTFTFGMKYKTMPYMISELNESIRTKN